LNPPFDAAEDAFFAWSAILPSSKTVKVRHLKRSRLSQPTHVPKSLDTDQRSIGASKSTMNTEGL
jgi:hypothetical protein